MELPLETIQRQDSLGLNVGKKARDIQYNNNRKNSIREERALVK